MHAEYYLHKLYPVQDKALDILNEEKFLLFYLTGGTALSRFYFQHRYSDDLDFFSNQSDSFLQDILYFEEKLKSVNMKYQVIVGSPTFRRFVIEEDTQLKIDFVNDVGFRFGTPMAFPAFTRVDNLRNILSNKLTALERMEPKDVADILFICRNLSFQWEDIFNDALQKVSFIDPITISKFLSEFEMNFLERLNWNLKLDLGKAEKDIRLISMDIVKKSKNTICSF